MMFVKQHDPLEVFASNVVFFLKEGNHCSLTTQTHDLFVLQYKHKFRVMMPCELTSAISFWKRINCKSSNLHLLNASPYKFILPFIKN